jgi:hypothetical protein
MYLNHEIALAAAVALPALAIMGMNAWLALTGERHTLLMPAALRFAPLGHHVTVVREVSAQQIDTAIEPCNDVLERLAA